MPRPAVIAAREWRPLEHRGHQSCSVAALLLPYYTNLESGIGCRVRHRRQRWQTRGGDGPRCASVGVEAAVWAFVGPPHNFRFVFEVRVKLSEGQVIRSEGQTIKG